MDPIRGGPRLQYAMTIFVRTYATAMAVWALAKAQKDPELRSPLYDEKLHDGVSILLNTYKSGTPGGWSTRRDQSGSIEGLFGLTMQIFYILTQTAELPAFGASIRNSSASRTCRCHCEQQPLSGQGN